MQATWTLFVRLYDPEVIVRPLKGWPEPGPFVGRDAVMRQWERQRETFDTDAVELIGTPSTRVNESW